MGSNVTIVNLDKTYETFKNQYVGCVVLTQNGLILLQQRPTNFKSYPGYLCEFGGKIEVGEGAFDALVREMKEELGGKVYLNDVVSFSAITESMSEDNELIHTYFWHDRQGSITGCYEGEARYFKHVRDILEFPKLTDGLRWLLLQCQNKNLIR